MSAEQESDSHHSDSIPDFIPESDDGSDQEIQDFSDGDGDGDDKQINQNESLKSPNHAEYQANGAPVKASQAESIDADTEAAAEAESKEKTESTTENNNSSPQQRQDDNSLADDTSAAASHSANSNSNDSNSQSPPPANPNSSSATYQVNSSSSSSSSSSSRSALRCSLLRLQSDLKSLESDPPDSCTAAPIDPSNLFLWRGCIFGVPDSEWEGAILSIQMNFPPDYPQRPPKLRFTSPIFHPNVFPADGSICIDILTADKWSPVYTISTILTSIQSLLTDPNISSPANPEAAQLLASNPKEYRKRIRSTIAKS